MRVDIVDVLANGTDAAAGDAAKQFGFIHTNVDGDQRGRLPEDGKMSIEPRRLRESTREAVKNVAGVNVVGGETDLHHIVDDMVRNQLPLIHQRLSELPQLCSFGDV